MITTVFAVIIFQVFLPIFQIRMVDEIGIDTKPILLTSATKYIVDLVHRDKETVLRFIRFGGSEGDRLSFQIRECPEQFFRTGM